MLMTPKVTTIGSIMREDVVCSGVLVHPRRVHPRWVLTSASCLLMCLGMEDSHADVFLGGERLDVFESTTDVHPRWVLTSASCLPVHPRWVLTSAACLPVCMGMEDCQADVFLGGEHFDVVETRVDPRALMENKEAMVLAKLSGPSSAMPLELYDGGDIGTNDCTGLSITQLSASPPGWNATSNASMPGTSMVMSNVSQVLPETVNLEQERDGHEVVTRCECPH
ncbi:hypothetical protein T484DRAFT_1823098 [Baffinella frigidus]|nr:hypothetical protein T484DRAFT_1823098 [Cryptophyta sp. CCMP2293]